MPDTACCKTFPVYWGRWREGHNGRVSQTEDRRSLLRGLISMDLPAGIARQRLWAFPWDSDTELVLLTRADCVRLLDSYLNGEQSAEECEAWAEAIEGRDDIGLEEGASDRLKSFLMELSTPEVTRPLSRESAREWRQALA